MDIQSKFNYETVRQYRRDLDDIAYAISGILYKLGVNKLEHEDTDKLMHAFECTTKTAGMLNNMIEQTLQGEIVTSEPMHYINTNLGFAHKIITIIKEKYKGQLWD